MRRLLPLLALPAVLAALAGCGSSSKSSSSQTTQTTAPSTPPATTSGTTSTASSSGGAAAPATGKTDTIIYQNIAIQPANITVHVGDKIKWINKDQGVLHNVQSQSGPLHLASNTFGGGGTYEVTASAPGVVHYLCSIHPTAMIGTITIVK